MSKDKRLSNVHLDWLVDRRSECQKCSLMLYKILNKHSKLLKELEGAANIAQGLVAVSFSLWRAVFLGDGTGSMEDVVRHAEDFLYKVIVDNMISYPNDRNANEWTFLYYVNNARYRMEGIRESLPNLVSHDLAGTTDQTPTAQWDYYHGAFVEMVEGFGRLLDKAA